VNGENSSASALLPGAPPPGPDRPGRPSGTPLRGRVALSVALVISAGMLAGAGYFVFGGRGGTASTAVEEPAARASTGNPAETAPAANGTAEAVPAAASRNPFSGGATPALPAATGSATAAPVTGPATAGSVTATVTVTAEPPTYVGLYGYTAAKADFWVNDTEYVVAVGKTFGSDFTFANRTDEDCAEVTRGEQTATICVGEVHAFE
jgi:hypothetical protein